jgi:hypothetical protein
MFPDVVTKMAAGEGVCMFVICSVPTNLQLMTVNLATPSTVDWRFKNNCPLLFLNMQPDITA